MTEEEMDNFVFAVLPKKTATKMQKELPDLVNPSFMTGRRIKCILVLFMLWYKRNQNGVSNDDGDDDDDNDGDGDDINDDDDVDVDDDDDLNDDDGLKGVFLYRCQVEDAFSL